MKTKKTNRGFTYSEFHDRYDVECSLQESSLVEPCIWFGVNRASPRYMKSQYAEVGLPRPEGELIGWEEYPLPDGVSFTTRMHLTQKQVAELIPVLQYFVDTGELPE